MPDSGNNSGATGGQQQGGQQGGGQQQTGQGQGNTQGQGQQGGNSQPLTYDAWLPQQTDEVKALIEGHIQGLRNTVQATRQERDALSQKLGDIAKTLGKDPAEAKRLLDAMTSEVEQANQRAGFYEEAARPEIGCSNPRLAYLAAVEAGLIDKRGRVSWESLKQQAPELFRGTQPRPAGNAGAGTGTQPPAGKNMNDFIRRSAGR